ncbi:hypothetical protein CFI10_13655 [Marinobacterium iners]|uniref:hypothetical protein n=1 Tax=Marinobacterium iners TaxID=48076 RepID=UPI001A8F1447|nr:hypothetical protein [Marinobacterium iners]QSR36027.1 hypothetical protein CFI10_13655 [Marinobacterium iners]
MAPGNRQNPIALPTSCVLHRRVIREVEPVLHISVRQRWLDQSVRYSSPALRALLARVNNDWERVGVVE